MSIIRTFIAIRLPGEIEKALGQLAEAMRPLWPERGVRWVKAENIHLTLRFLGDTKDEQVAGIEKGLLEIAGKHEGFELALAGSGCFPNERKPRVIWTGVEGREERLGVLQRDIEMLVRGLGWEAERRDFVPHLTLGRVRQGVKAPQGGWLKDPARLAFRVSGVELIESVLKPGGAEYRTLCRVELRG